jgi:hypothetical protein
MMMKARVVVPSSAAAAAPPPPPLHIPFRSSQVKYSAMLYNMLCKLPFSFDLMLMP